MKQTVNLTKFVQAFKEYNREDNFSYHGLELLFDYFESIDENMELDVIAICCGYEESSIDYVVSSYNINIDECKNLPQIIDTVSNYLQENTIFLGKTDKNTFVFANF